MVEQPFIHQSMLKIFNDKNHSTHLKLPIKGNCDSITFLKSNIFEGTVKTSTKLKYFDKTLNFDHKW